MRFVPALSTLGYLRRRHGLAITLHSYPAETWPHFSLLAQALEYLPHAEPYSNAVKSAQLARALRKAFRLEVPVATPV